MKNYAKVGGKKGMPAFRTPSSFHSRKCLKTAKTKIIKNDFYFLKNKKDNKK